MSTIAKHKVIANSKRANELLALLKNEMCLL